eukprot:12550473-Ditylum_brightwellii.AAC.1
MAIILCSTESNGDDGHRTTKETIRALATQIQILDHVLQRKTNIVFIYKECWYQHEIVRKTRLIIEFQQEGTRSRAPKEAIPLTDVRKPERGLFYRSTTPSTQPPKKARKQKKATTFREYVDTLP